MKGSITNIFLLLLMAGTAYLGWQKMHPPLDPAATNAGPVVPVGASPETIYEQILKWKDKCVEDDQMTPEQIAAYQSAPDGGKVRGRELAPEAAVTGLPDLRGANMLPGLHEAMRRDLAAGDEKLANAVKALAARDFLSLFTPDERVVKEFESMMYLWGGVENIDPAQRGEFSDGRQITFLDRARGYRFLHGDVYYMLAPHYGGNIQSAAFRDMRNAFYAAFFRQTAAARTMFLPNGALNPGAIELLAEGAAQLKTEGQRFRFWKSVVRFISVRLVERLAPANRQALADAIAKSAPGLTLAQVTEAVVQKYSLRDLDGKTLNRDGRRLAGKVIIRAGQTRRSICIKYLDNLPVPLDEQP